MIGLIGFANSRLVNLPKYRQPAQSMMKANTDRETKCTMILFVISESALRMTLIWQNKDINPQGRSSYPRLPKRY